jgi:lysophospholipase L1-like esterase
MTRHQPLATLTAVIGVALLFTSACGQSSNGTGEGTGGATGAGGSGAGGTSSTPGTGGQIVGTGGSTPVSTGGESSTGGGAGGMVGTGGAPTSGGTTSRGGASGTGGTASTGGEHYSGGTPQTGGIASTGGVSGGSGTGAAVGSGGKTGSGGVAVAGGTIGAGGTTGTTTGAGGAPPPTTGIPTGYPAPTADNYAKCKTVPIGGADNACAGQPAGNVCIECLFGGTTYNTSETTPTAEATTDAGNYLVSVTLGGASAGDTYISAESSRGLLPSVTTTAGQSVSYAFVVNVRAMEGQPQHAGGPGGYAGLDLFFSGKSPQVSAIGYALATTATKPVMVYIASDSTTCDQTGGAFGGWGQMLPEFFAPPVGIANYANSGASSSSFYGSSAFWGAIKAKWTAGDWVIVQFGHNDKGVADSAVQANLEKYVSDAQAAGVNALLVSPPARVQMSGGTEGDQSSLHAAAAQAAATAKSVPFIDLTALSTAWYNSLGSQSAALAFHANGSDATHTNLAGGAKLASLVANAIKTQNIGLAKYLR